MIPFSTKGTNLATSTSAAVTAAFLQLQHLETTIGFPLKQQLSFVTFGPHPPTPFGCSLKPLDVSRYFYFPSMVVG